MVIACPHCGHIIPEPLIDGLASCPKCSQVFTGSVRNRLLSAGWLVRRASCHGVEQLISDTRLADHEAVLVCALVGDSCYSHDEFVKALNELGITR